MQNHLKPFEPIQAFGLALNNGQCKKHISLYAVQIWKWLEFFYYKLKKKVLHVNKDFCAATAAWKVYTKWTIRNMKYRSDYHHCCGKIALRSLSFVHFAMCDAGGAVNVWETLVFGAGSDSWNRVIDCSFLLTLLKISNETKWNTDRYLIEPFINLCFPVFHFSFCSSCFKTSHLPYFSIRSSSNFEGFLKITFQIT